MQWLAAISVKRPVFARVLILSLTVVGAFAFTQLGRRPLPEGRLPHHRRHHPAAGRGAGAGRDRDHRQDRGSGQHHQRHRRAALDVVRRRVARHRVVRAREGRRRRGAGGARPGQPRAAAPAARPSSSRRIEKFDPGRRADPDARVSSNKPIRDVTEFADKVAAPPDSRASTASARCWSSAAGRARSTSGSTPARLRAYNLTVTDVVARAAGAERRDPGRPRRAGAGRRSRCARCGRVQIGRRSSTTSSSGRRDGHPILLRRRGARSRTAWPSRRRSPTSTARPRCCCRSAGSRARTPSRSSKHVKRAARATSSRRCRPATTSAIVRDQSEFIEASINSVEEHLVLGAILAALVVLALPRQLALDDHRRHRHPDVDHRDVRPDLVHGLHAELDDDARAHARGRHRHRRRDRRAREHLPVHRGEGRARRSRRRSRRRAEIGLAVLATTLSLVAVFLPVGFMGGIVGRFMKSFGLTMAFAIMVSLLVSFTLTPMMSARLARSAEPAHGKDASTRSKDSRVFRAVDAVYTRAARAGRMAHRGDRRGHRRRWCCSSSVPLFMIVPTRTFLPDDDQSEFEVNVRAPEGTSLEETELHRQPHRARASASSCPEVDYTLVDGRRRPGAHAEPGDDLRPPEAARGSATRDQFALMDAVREEILPQFAATNAAHGGAPVATIGGGGDAERRRSSSSSTART